MTGKQQQTENVPRYAAENTRLPDKCGVSCASAQPLRGHRGGNSSHWSFIGVALAKAVFGRQNSVQLVHMEANICNRCQRFY